MARELVHIIVQYCNDPRPERAAEYDLCVRRNLANPWVKQVHNLVEPQTVIPEDIRSHPKYVQVPTLRWLTYQDAIDYANRHLAEQCVCIANLDIFLDEQQTDWNHAMELISNEIAICLARWEWKSDSEVFKDPGLVKKAMATAQDAWFFKPPITVPDCDFELGIIGCDNAIAERFKRAGLLPMNVPNLLRICHVDQARGKTFENAARIHEQEGLRRPPSRMPHAKAQWLVPDIDELRSLDQLAQTLQLDAFQKYEAVCDLLNRYFLQARRPQ